jgi:hypothetical protein
LQILVKQKGSKIRMLKKPMKMRSLEELVSPLILLVSGKNIHNPTGWLMAALKYDYQNSEQEEREEDEKREKISSKRINCQS